jgi:hypothetical protein
MGINTLASSQCVLTENLH